MGFVIHATKKLTFGTDALVATAKKALFAMRRRSALLGIRDPALQCKLFDTLVLPILSYGCEVWEWTLHAVQQQKLYIGTF